jgi:hypothetical protein
MGFEQQEDATPRHERRFRGRWIRVLVAGIRLPPLPALFVLRN